MNNNEKRRQKKAARRRAAYEKKALEARFEAAKVRQDEKWHKKQQKKVNDLVRKMWGGKRDAPESEPYLKAEEPKRAPDGEPSASSPGFDKSKWAQPNERLV